MQRGKLHCYWAFCTQQSALLLYRYPYMVSLRRPPDNDANGAPVHYCGATLISPFVLLTAAHCTWLNSTAQGQHIVCNACHLTRDALLVNLRSVQLPDMLTTTCCLHDHCMACKRTEHLTGHDQNAIMLGWYNFTSFLPKFPDIVHADNSAL